MKFSWGIEFTATVTAQPAALPNLPKHPPQYGAGGVAAMIIAVFLINSFLAGHRRVM